MRPLLLMLVLCVAACGERQKPFYQEDPPVREKNRTGVLREPTEMVPGVLGMPREMPAEG